MPSSHLILCHPLLLLPSNLSQNQGLFKWVSSSHQVAKVLEFQFQHESFQWTCRVAFLYNGLVWSPCSPRDSQESSPTPQFKSISSSALSFLYSLTLISIPDYWKSIALTRWTFVGKVMSLLFNMRGLILHLILAKRLRSELTVAQIMKYLLPNSESRENHQTIQIWLQSNPLWLYSGSEK